MSKTGRGSDQFALRLPDGLREKIKTASDDNLRSMNAEIVFHLQRAFQQVTETEKGSVSA